jgi:hypothetical protein
MQMTLFDVQQRITLAELSTPFIKYVVWNGDMSSVALLSKHAIVIADKKLGNAQTVHETIRCAGIMLLLWRFGVGGLLLVCAAAQTTSHFQRAQCATSCAASCKGAAPQSQYRLSCMGSTCHACCCRCFFRRVKSAAWDDSGVLLYTTLNHIKYCLPNGDSGIIRTLDVPLYITRVSGNTIHALDRDGKARAVQVRMCDHLGLTA